MATVISPQTIVDYVNTVWAGAALNTQMGLGPVRPAPGFLAQPQVARIMSPLTNPGGGYLYPTANFNWTLKGFDQRRARLTVAPSTMLASDMPSVSALITYYPANALGPATSYLGVGLATSEIKGTQMSNTFAHPVYTGTVNTTVGTNYVKATFTRDGCWLPHGHNTLRIESGADRGVYQITHYDIAASNVYLRNLDGSAFNGKATATGVNASAGTRWGYFNEVGVIPVGVGTATFSGQFQPGENRTSYIARVQYEKTGNCTAGYTQGNYWFTLRQYRLGNGWQTGDYGVGNDNGYIHDQCNQLRSGTTRSCVSDTCVNIQPCGTGVVLDKTNQRVWLTTCGLTPGAGGNIMWKWYKSPDAFHEAAVSTGVNSELIAGLDISSANPVAMEIGTGEQVYVALNGGANAGVVRINSTFDPTATTATQGRASADWGLTGVTSVINLLVDKSRNRTGTAGDVTTVAATNIIPSASAAFSATDIGRAIKLTGGADAGVYLIATVTNSTHVTVTTLAGGAVSFTGAAGATFSIGDRIYVFFNDATTNAGKVRYLESLAPMTQLFSRTVTMTAGANSGLAGTNVQIYQNTPMDIDPRDGVIYWSSIDTAVQINRYDPATNTWSRRLLSAFTGLNGGTGTLPTPTQINGIGFNPHASFRELWVATDAGHIRLDPDNFTGTYDRYYGNAMTYAVNGVPQGDGGTAPQLSVDTRNMQSYAFALDGRVYAQVFYPTRSDYNVISSFSREANSWSCAIQATGDPVMNMATNQTAARAFMLDTYGGGVCWVPSAQGTSWSSTIYREVTTHLHYQWIGGVWVPKEVVRNALPDATAAGCQCKPLHTTTDDLVMGVKVSFTPQGGATPPNNEFLGRVGQTAAQRTDGATTSGSATFTGSGFTSNDTGRYLRIESGTSQGIYVATYVDANHVTLKKQSGTVFSAAATAATLSYTLWEMQINAGPETATCLLADGIGKDNTSTVTGITGEYYYARTALAEQAENIKFAINTENVGAGGKSTTIQVAFVNMPKVALGYPVGIPQHLALDTMVPSANYMIRNADVRGAATGRTAQTVDSTFGRKTASTVSGASVTVDFGADVEVGSIMVQGVNDQPTEIQTLANNNLNTSSYGGGGLITFHKAVDAPVASSVTRTSGTGNLNTVLNSDTLTLTSGDFLGTQILAGVDGQTTAATSTFGSAVGTFLAAHVGMALKINGAAAGTYRIAAVAGDGASCTIQNLDLTDKTFVMTASGITWSIWDSVQPEDMISVGVHSLGVERLLTTSTAQVRVFAGATLSNQNWSCLKPTWDLVKRVSRGIGYAPPEVYDNGTFVTDGTQDPARFHIVASLADLSMGKRTGRYWKFNVMAAYDGKVSYYPMTVDSLAFYGTSGKLIGSTPYNTLDGLDANPTFQACQVNRIDWIQATNAAGANSARFNGVASIVDAAKVTVTLDNAGRVFMGHNIRTGTTGAMTAAGNTLTISTGTDAGFVGSDVGRFLEVTSGANVGFYRIAGVISATQASLTSPSGLPMTWASTLSSQAYVIREGVAAGDFIAFPDPTNDNTVEERLITAVADNLLSLTIAYPFVTSVAGKKWEVRRHADASDSTTVDSGYMARIVYSSNAAPLQPGDIAQAIDGHLEFWGEDVTSRAAQSNGASTAASGTFTCSGATADDVGRILTITSGADQGVYRILTVPTSTTVTLGNLKTGTAVTLTATASSLAYRITGDRRFRASRYVSILRS